MHFDNIMSNNDALIKLHTQKRRVFMFDVNLFLNEYYVIKPTWLIWFFYNNLTSANNN
jgi:hypothetical protein